MQSTIKWILFDISGVIIHFTFINPDGYRIGTRFFSREELEGIFSSKDFNTYMLGLISHEQFVGRHLKKKKLDLSIGEFDELFKKDIVPIEGMKTLLEKLSQKYKVALATNGGKENTKYRIEGSGILPHLSKVIASYRIRELKPSTEFYKKMLKMIEAKPEECIFIDDTKENVNAANSLGIKGILFKSTSQLEKELEDFLKI